MSLGSERDDIVVSMTNLHLFRKLWHVGGGILIVSTLAFLPRVETLTAMALLFAADLAVEIVRLRNPAVNARFVRFAASLIRSSEHGKISGTPPFLAGCLAAAVLFPLPVAIAGILFLTFGDVAATTVGERFGRTRIGGKSLEGTGAFLAASALVSLGVVLFPHAPPLGALIAGAGAAAAVEFLPLPVNDNFTIPVVSAAVIHLLS
ncbi:MAG: hypothetical protein A2V83_11020 [Nitrospirae bacterium RBG_16_64_22]|nr:MAG: hypothetical protein A2V83_11020 [Nitrospirae bacterium RBG_16_64_22]